MVWDHEAGGSNPLTPTRLLFNFFTMSMDHDLGGNLLEEEPVTPSVESVTGLFAVDSKQFGTSAVIAEEGIITYVGPLDDELDSDLAGARPVHALTRASIDLLRFEDGRPLTDLEKDRHGIK